VVDFKLQLMALIPTRSHEEISLPQVRSEALVVRARRRRFNTKMFVWIDALFVSRIRRWKYCDALRCASARCDSTSKRDQDLQMSVSSEERAPSDNTYWWDSETSWIKRERNSITRRYLDGSGVVREGASETWVTRGVSMETNLSCKEIIKS